ncbi:Uncharacterised protein family (UPF0150) [Kingella potus]|uniref:HicB-like antitoxin of toxin-antitoxin system domain-containing protein n=1 Tax=Kingella potus TaxID=265175 RepID=A0A377QXY2_9NEIS|nr:type II toxin-antitoxin system HicB family antitoxin [Kingella potus]UOP00512.1 type II toxin-antitoxin system HicB family antitoxin [Kingella potus]UOP02042.1 type II toxin-antitoxin system HicB family antitoxin [Kingella potus]STQ99867.1 Uncharacterised protein family (UPF0150) [Kingella potus]STR02410.1 Uncharacterised protein family (UPF0150) [Kingella potus]
MIYYPAALFQDAGQSGYGIVIPDLPGCYPVGDTVEEALADAKAAAAFHIEGMIAESLEYVTAPRGIAELRSLPDYADALMWVLVEVDETVFSKQTRFNVSWPQYLLDRVDEYTAIHHETRSGFLARAALDALNRS